MHWPVHNELAFGSIAAPNILEHKDVTIGNELSKSAIDGIRVIFADTVRGALYENRQSLFLVLRREDKRVQAHAVAHANHLFVFVEWDVALN